MPSAADILSVLSQHRRLPTNELGREQNFSQELIDKINGQIDRGEQLRLVVPSFPDKSVARGKTLSDNADMAELISLRYLASIVEEIKAVYPPGALLVIYSDGVAFEGIRDHRYTKRHRENYLDDLEALINKNGLQTSIIVERSDDIDLAPFVETEDHLRDRLKNPQSITDKDAAILHGAQKKFWETELAMLYPEKSKTKRLKEASAMACGITRMSAAFSQYLDKVEPDAIRLSCHPKTADSNKVGIWFNAVHSQCTPWHTAAVFGILDGKCSVEFKKSSEVDKSEFRLQHDANNRPSHFESDRVYSAATTIQKFFKEHRSISKEKTGIATAP